MGTHNSRLDDLELRLLKVEEATHTLAGSGTQPINGFSNRGASSRPSITRSCALKIINIIKSNLEKENLENFENSCFGHLMKINELRFQGQLMFHLLLNIDMGASSKKSLVFKIHNSNMEFGKRDFHQITGLCFGERKVTSTSSFIHEHVFRGRPSIMFKEVEEMFLKYSSVYGGKGELTLKLALLYFLYGILLSGSGIKKIDTMYLYLIENLHEFNAFSWGEVAHEFLVSSLLSARIRMSGSKVSRLNIYGFGFALQIWAYEKMSSLAAYCANDLGDLTPQILRWSATKIIRFETLKKFFGGDAHLEERQLRGEDAFDLLLEKFVPRNESLKVGEEENLNKAEEPALTSNPISKLERSSDEMKRARPLRENPARDMLLLYQEYIGFDLSKPPEYERSKILYERLLNPREHLKLWISYAKFEAFGTREKDESDSSHRRKCFERAKAVIERGLTYFRSSAPELKEERSMLLKEWFDIESSFRELDDEDLVLAMLPQKHNKQMLEETEERWDGMKRRMVSLL